MQFILWALVLTFPAVPAFAQSAVKVRTVPVAHGLEHPWGMAFLPDGRLLVTERPGRLRIVDHNGLLSAPIINMPPVFAHDQGGLLDVAIDPDFEKNQLIYLSFAEEINAKTGTAVARAQLKETSLERVEVIFRQYPRVDSSKHFGSRLVFARDGTLFITLGERFNYDENAQTLDNHHGKLIRINPDGSIPPDNPFVSTPGALPEIWSFGHRNMQGAARHPKTGKIWIHEHGPRGGDEVNIPEAGKNYGWPLVSYGRQYSGWPIPDTLDHRHDLTYPVYHWTPSIAPSGMLFYTGNKFPLWHGDLFIGSLAKKHLNRLKLDGERVIKEERLLEPLEVRIRDVEQGPNGYIYVLTDERNGRILRLEPKI